MIVLITAVGRGLQMVFFGWGNEGGWNWGGDTIVFLCM